MLSATSIAQRGRATLQRLAALGRAETVTLHHKTTANAAPAAHSIGPVTVEEFSARELDTGEVLRTDRRFRLPVAGLPAVPTRWSTLERADGSVWQVQHIRGGPGTPFWLVQGRQVG